MDNEMTRITNDLEEKLRKVTAERNVFKAKYRSLISLVEKMRSELRQITDHIDDEGDRTYFGSTNHADTLRNLANYTEMWVFDYELPPGDINKMEKDPYAEIRRLREECEALAAHQCLFLDESGLTGERVALRCAGRRRSSMR